MLLLGRASSNRWGLGGVSDRSRSFWASNNFYLWAHTLRYLLSPLKKGWPSQCGHLVPTGSPLAQSNLAQSQAPVVRPERRGDMVRAPKSSKEIDHKKEIQRKSKEVGLFQKNNQEGRRQEMVGWRFLFLENSRLLENIKNCTIRSFHVISTNIQGLFINSVGICRP